jgi:UDPglucose 6-dehydrogenase
VVGLGKLGLCLAAVLADSGFRVWGIDVDRRRVEAIERGTLRSAEPRLEALLRSTRGVLQATTQYEAVKQTRATFVVVPTPSKKSGEFSLEYVAAAMKEIGAALAGKRGYHLVVLCSTVMPGSMDEVVLPTLQRASGKKVPEELGLCYNPEFIALGNVIDGLRNPDFVLVGESDEKAGEMLGHIQSKMCSNNPSMERMGFLNAELTKISVNAFVTMKMSFANTLAEICERLPGGDVDKVTRAIGRDRRIGANYLRGAIGYGGPCFPRDNVAFARFAKKVGVSADLARATDTVNRRQVERILKIIEDRRLPKSSSIGVLGIAYKQDTNVFEASQPLMLATALAESGYKVHVYDPAVDRSMLPGLPNLRVEPSADACLAASDLCVIATPWKSFSRIEKSKLSGKTVLDCWRILNGNRPGDPSRYLALGQDMVTSRVSRS